jgi:NAD(P)-dependent dehydrogenase (short-subunit alcohol dehydrogenase family)
LIEEEEALERSAATTGGVTEFLGVPVHMGDDGGGFGSLESNDEFAIMPAGGSSLVGALSGPQYAQACVLPGDVEQDDAKFPPGQLDPDGQQMDLRVENSWALLVGEIHPLEMLEVQLINVFAPFVLISALTRCFAHACEETPCFIVNVTSAEGQFSGFKAPIHPHTNAAKAALNQITRTCALDLARYVFVYACVCGTKPTCS